MKKLMMTLAAVLCCAMTTTVLTSCNSDDSDDESTAPQNNVVTVFYEFTLGQAYMDFYDIYCTYTDVNGKVQMVQCTAKTNYYSESVAYDKAPDNYEFSVRAVPKTSHPTIVPDSTYDMSEKYTVSVAVRPSADANLVYRLIMDKVKTKTTKVRGSRLAEQLEASEVKIIEKVTGSK